MNRHRTGVALVAAPVFSTTLAVGLGVVRYFVLPLDGGGGGKGGKVVLKHSYKVQPLTQRLPTCWHLQVSDRMHFFVVLCMHHCRTSQKFGLVSGGSEWVGLEVILPY